MLLFRSFVKTFDTLSRTRKYILNSKIWNDSRYFGSKIEIPPPPKRPLTAYMLYCKENRSNLLEKTPSLTNPEQMKILAKDWNNLTEEMKEPYKIKAKESTVLYGEAHKEYYENLSEEQKEEIARLKSEKKNSRNVLKLKRALRESGVPKAAATAYALFVRDEAKNKNISTSPATVFIKKVAELWKSLPEAAKKVYINRAQEDKLRFKKELEEWKIKMKSEGKDDLLKVYEERKGRRKTAGSHEPSKNKKDVIVDGEKVESLSKTSKN